MQKTINLLGLTTLKKALQIALLPKSRPHHQGARSPIAIAGAFSTASGIGESARNIYQCLESEGFDPLAIDLSGFLNQVDLVWDGPSTSLPRDFSGILILVVNAPETRAMLKAMKLRRWRKCRIIGYWAWELNRPPSTWKPIARHLDEIWVPSDYTRSVLIELNMQLSISTIPIPIYAGAEHTPIRRGDVAAKCLIMADGRSSFARKNILAAVQIFSEAVTTGLQAQLTVKTRNAAEYPSFYRTLNTIANANPMIDVLDESLSNEQRWELIRDHDIVISAHRAEGFGMHLAEAMSLGKVVLATGWSGNMQFMKEGNSILLPYTLVDVEDTTEIYESLANAAWAEVDVHASAESLRSLLADRDLGLEIGKRAVEDVRTQLKGSELLDKLRPL